MFSLTDNYKLYQSLPLQINYLHILELVHPDVKEREQSHILCQQLLKDFEKNNQNNNDNMISKIEELRYQFNNNLKEDKRPLSDEIWFSIADSENEETRKEYYLLMENYNSKNKTILEEFYNVINNQYNQENKQNFAEIQANKTFGENGYQYVIKFLDNIKNKYKPYFDEMYKNIDSRDKKDWNRRYIFKNIIKNKNNMINQDSMNINDVIKTLVNLWNQIYNINVELSIVNNLFGINNDVNIYQFNIYQKGDNQKELVGIIYGDFMFREGKYQRGMTTDFIGRDNNKYGVSYVITSFKNELLKYDDVKTLFHEMGHGLHKAITNINLTPENSTFREVPSTFNENLIYSDEFYKLSNIKYSKDEQNMCNQIIGDLINSYISLEFFTNPNFLENRSKEIYQEIMGFSLDNEIIHPEFQFTHLFTMKSQYYLYLMNDLMAELILANEPKDKFLDRMINNNFVY
jgi:hypothetical protein